MSIINRPLNFIYLKSHKTASSSIEAFLINETALGSDMFCTSRDILKIGDRRFQDRKRKIFKLPFTHYFFDIPSQYYVRGIARLFPHIKEHQSGIELKSILGTDFWGKALKSTSVRNPWDAMVSLYRWVKVGRYGRSFPKDLDWDDFLMRVCKVDECMTGWSIAQEYLFYPYLFDENACFVDHVFYFEDLRGSFAELKETLDLSASDFDKAAYFFKNNRSQRDYRKDYTDDQALLVLNHFSELLALFPYQFEKINSKPF